MTFLPTPLPPKVSCIIWMAPYDTFLDCAKTKILPRWDFLDQHMVLVWSSLKSIETSMPTTNTFFLQFDTFLFKLSSSNYSYFVYKIYCILISTNSQKSKKKLFGSSENSFFTISTLIQSTSHTTECCKRRRAKNYFKTFAKSLQTFLPQYIFFLPKNCDKLSKLAYLS